MRFQKLALAFIAIFLFVHLLPISAAAEPTLQVKITAGVNGKAKIGKGLPITITVENTGDAFSGDIVLDVMESYSLGSGQVIPFDIAAGETKTIQLALAGLGEDYVYNNNPNTKSIYFYEGGWEKGKSIDYKGTKNLRANFSDPSAFFYMTLTDSADRLGVFKQLRNNNQVFHLAQETHFSFPNEAVAWEMADFLIVDEYVLADLEERQQQAIKDYVANGGYLLVGASDNTAAELGLLAENLPLTLSSSTATLSPEEVKPLTGKNVLTNDLKIYDSSLKEGAVPLFKLGEHIVAAKQQIGSGAVIQTTFSLGDDPLAKDPVYKDLMLTLLNSVKKQNNTSMNYGYYPLDNLIYEVGNTNSLFSSFKVSTPLMITIVIIYMILVGPLLYFLLKRKDKREYAWVIIPVISIVASAAIFGYGAKDRIAKPQVQVSSFLYVNEDKSVNGYYAQALLSNKGGDFTFTAPSSTQMSAQRTYNGLTGSSGNIHENAIQEKSASASELTFRDVGYWTVSSLFGSTRIENVGSFDVDLRVEASKLIGTIKNDFGFTVKDAAIWSGTKLIKLGDIQPGEEISVNKELGTVMLTPTANPYINSNWYMNPTSNVDLKTQRMQSLYSSSKMLDQVGNSPAITGFAEDHLLPVELKDKKADLSSLHLLIQPFQAETTFAGEFVLPATIFDIDITTDEYGKMMEPAENTSNLEWYLDDGEYQVTWSMPDTLPRDKVSYKQLQVANTDRNNLTVEVYNYQTELYESIEESRFTVTEDLERYINPDGEVRYKLIKKSMHGDPYTRLPEIRVKGDVSK